MLPRERSLGGGIRVLLGKDFLRDFGDLRFLMRMATRDDSTSCLENALRSLGR